MIRSRQMTDESACIDSIPVHLSDVPASCRSMSSRSSRDTTPSPSTSYTSNRNRTRSSRLARALKAARMRTNSCATQPHVMMLAACVVAPAKQNSVISDSVPDV